MVENVAGGSSAMRMWCTVSAAAIFAICAAGPAQAWVYPEHRNIAMWAVQNLDPDRRALFDRLWTDAQSGAEDRLCASGADEKLGLLPRCIDWASLPAIAGDHSCSAGEMLAVVRTSDWILDVAGIAARLDADLARIPSSTPRLQLEGVPATVTDARRFLEDRRGRARLLYALRTADTRLERADRLYATRAGLNNAHFMLARPDTSLDLDAHLTRSIDPGSETNAVGVYAWYHASALRKASRLADGTLSIEERRALARAALADEAFALHFLEDLFAAGHVAGSWGDVAQRKGTHDFYNEFGLEVFTWDRGKSTVVLMGDAHMRPEDLTLAGLSARTSLEQVLDAAAGRYEMPDTSSSSSTPAEFDVCKAAVLPNPPDGLPIGVPYRSLVAEVLRHTPVPGLTPGRGAMPRFRSEVGPFIGISSAVGVRSVDGGFEKSQTENGFISGFDLAFRAGLGLEGALSEGSDGLMFIELGAHADTSSTNQFIEGATPEEAGSLTAAIPARWGATVRTRMPYYVFPGDLLVLSPMYFFNRPAYTRMAVTAVNGGLLRWQQAVATRAGRIQFVLGREVGFSSYGVGTHTEVLMPGVTLEAPLRLVRFRSTAYELPVVEYRPYRAYSSDQSSSLLFQFFVRSDRITDLSVLGTPTEPDPSLKPVRSIGARMVFTWRHYW